MNHDERTANALKLLEALTSAPHHRLAVSVACRTLACSADDLDGYLELLSTLANRSSGTRAIVYRDGNELVLAGDAAYTNPLRLTPGEAVALRHVLDALHLDPSLAERVSKALLPPNTRESETGRDRLADTRSFGAYYQELIEAIEDGVRCRIFYKAQAEERPSVRVVDPLGIETSQDSTYLIAWNVQKDEERRYRLDRIYDVELTDDSVEPRRITGAPVAACLAQQGEEAVIEFSPQRTGRIDPTAWIGATACTPSPTRAGYLRTSVHVSTPAWLFDQLLAAGGTIELIGPLHLRRAFFAYAEQLRRGIANHKVADAEPDTSAHPGTR